MNRGTVPNPAEAKAERLNAARSRLLDETRELVDRDFILAVHVIGFTPTTKQVDYALAYVCSEPSDSYATILRKANVDAHTLRRWRVQARFRYWIARVALSAVALAVPLGWRVLTEIGLAGNVQALRLMLQRFDLEWQARTAKEYSPVAGAPPPEAELKQLRNSLPTSSEEGTHEGTSGPSSHVRATGVVPGKDSTGSGQAGEATEAGGEGVDPAHT